MTVKGNMNFALIVITAYDEHSLKLTAMRRKQCEKYNIPVVFVYNGDRPKTYELQKDEVHCELRGARGINPIMLYKCILGIKVIEEHYKLSPTFFIRCNATCFINFNKLSIVLRNLPLHHCIAGRFDSKYMDILFCNGTCMILSNDVAKKLCQEDILNIEANNQMTFIENDDVAISWLGRKYAVLFDLSYWFSIFEGLTSLPTALPAEPRHIVFYRIKNPADRNTIDVGLWKMLEEKWLM
jgi:hypothetical protein